MGASEFSAALSTAKALQTHFHVAPAVHADVLDFLGGDHAERSDPLIAELACSPQYTVLAFTGVAWPTAIGTDQRQAPLALRVSDAHGSYRLDWRQIYRALHSHPTIECVLFNTPHSKEIAMKVRFMVVSSPCPTLLCRSLYCRGKRQSPAHTLCVLRLLYNLLPGRRARTRLEGCRVLGLKNPLRGRPRGVRRCVHGGDGARGRHPGSLRPRKSCSISC